jgi:teichuronic acid biosynthesis glycosyltransferase TuaH
MSEIPLDSRLWDGLVVLCAANNYNGIKVADWHTAKHLSRLVPVLYVDPPLSRLTPLRRPETSEALRGPRLRILGPGLARLTPVVQPFPSRPMAVGMTSVLVRGQLRKATCRLGGRVRAVLSSWPQYSVFGSSGEEVRVYWAQDDYVGGAALLGLSARQLDRHERRIAAAADFVVAASPALAEAWRTRGHDVILIPYGADLDSYSQVDQAPVPADACLPGPVAGVVGRINARTDLRLLEAIADRGRSLLLVGPKDSTFEPRRFDVLLNRPNVHWVGPKPFEALPGYLRAIDVGLVPYRDSAFNQGSFPLKTLEYLAAGRAVVATDLPATRWLATDLVAVASGPEAFADQVDRLLAQPRTQSVTALRRAFAARHSWAQRVAEIHEAIARR